MDFSPAEMIATAVPKHVVFFCAAGAVWGVLFTFGMFLRRQRRRSRGGLSKDEFFVFGLIVAPIASALIGFSVATVYEAHNLDGSRGTLESEAERLYGLVISEDVGDDLRYYDNRAEYLQGSDLEEGFASSEVHRFGTAELLVDGEQQIVQLVWKGEWMLAEASTDGETIIELPTVPAQP